MLENAERETVKKVSAEWRCLEIQSQKFMDEGEATVTCMVCVVKYGSRKFCKNGVPIRQVVTLVPFEK